MKTILLLSLFFLVSCSTTHQKISEDIEKGDSTLAKFKEENDKLMEQKKVNQNIMDISIPKPRYKVQKNGVSGSMEEDLNTEDLYPPGI